MKQENLYLGIQQKLWKQLWIGMIKTLPPGDFESSLLFHLSAWSTERQGKLISPVSKPRSYIGAKLTFWQQHPESWRSCIFCPLQICHVLQPDMPSDCQADIWHTWIVLACCMHSFRSIAFFSYKRTGEVERNWAECSRLLHCQKAANPSTSPLCLEHGHI